MKKDNLIYLDHILESLQRALDYVDSVSYEEFIADEEKQDAVIRKIEVAGEARKKISQNLRDKYNQITWRAIAGMRDKLIHDYFDVDLEVVWNSLTNEVPGVIPNLKSVILDLEK